MIDNEPVIDQASARPVAGPVVSPDARQLHGQLREPPWRVGRSYGIHVYSEDVPIATFHQPADAQLAVAAVNSRTSPSPIVISALERQLAEKERQLTRCRAMANELRRELRPSEAGLALARVRSLISLWDEEVREGPVANREGLRKAIDQLFAALVARS